MLSLGDNNKQKVYIDWNSPLIEKRGDFDEGNNTEPVKSGRCCDNCNIMRVIPARLKNCGVTK